MKRSSCECRGKRKVYNIGWQEEAEAASPRLSRRTLITIIYNMYARTYACPGATDFFLFIYFHTEVRKAIRSMNLLSTFVFFFVCMCMRVRVRVFYVCDFYNYFFLICLLFRDFFFTSIIWFSYFLLSHNNTLSDFLIC